MREDVVAIFGRLMAAEPGFVLCLGSGFAVLVKLSVAPANPAPFVQRGGQRGGTRNSNTRA
jgi:hypothetical protein